MLMMFLAQMANPMEDLPPVPGLDALESKAVLPPTFWETWGWVVIAGGLVVLGVGALLWRSRRRPGSQGITDGFSGEPLWEAVEKTEGFARLKALENYWEVCRKHFEESPDAACQEFEKKLYAALYGGKIVDMDELSADCRALCHARLPVKGGIHGG